MIEERVFKADSKGRIVLGNEYAGAFFGMNPLKNGFFLQQIKFVPLNENISEVKKEKKGKNILKLAGAWEEMKDSDFNNFLTDVKKRRAKNSKRPKVWKKAIYWTLIRFLFF